MSAVADMLAQIPPEQRQAVAEALEIQVQELAVMLEHYTSLGAEQRRVLAEQAVGEQIQIAQQIIPTLQGDMAAKYPTIGVQVWGPQGAKGLVKAPKRMEGITDVGEAIHFAMIAALIQAAGPRTVLRAYGFNYSFVQVPEQPKSRQDKPKIIL